MVAQMRNGLCTWRPVLCAGFDVLRVPLMSGINPLPWQTDTSNGDWFYAAGDTYKTAPDVIRMLADIVSKNGTNERWQDLVGDGLPPSPVGGLVTLDNGQTVPFCIGCSPLGSIEGKIVPSLSSVVRPKGRVYWYIQK